MHSMSLVMYFNKLTNRDRYLAKGKKVKIISVTYDSTGIDFFKQKFEHSIQLENCSNFKCEEEFKKNYELFLNDPKKVLYVIKFEFSKEFHHLRFIVSFIESSDKILK